MVRIPSLSRRPETSTQDGNRDGHDDQRTTGTPRVADTVVSSRPAPTRTADPDGSVATHRRPGIDSTADIDREPEVVVPAGPHPRASLLATLGLIFGVTAVLVVLTGALAGYGIGLGVIALVLSIGGISATGRRTWPARPTP